MQIENCTADLLRDSHAAARERGIPFTVHIAQSVNEVQEMIRRHGMTPVQWAHEIGILDLGTILGHALFLDTHSWIRWWTKTVGSRSPACGLLRAPRSRACVSL